MKIAMIGLGDIAEKAYLPVLAAQPDLELHLCTRNKAALDRIGDAHRVTGRSTAVSGVVEAGVDAAFVHAATAAHFEIVEPLLRAGVPVYLDKPITSDLASSTELVRLAAGSGVSLMVGFNRRVAYAGLAGLPRDLVLMQKNRAHLPDEPRRAVFDDFIHVVDTLRFLAPGEVTSRHIRTRVRDGLIEHIVLELAGEGFSAIGIMNRVGAASEESCEVMGAGAKRRIVNLGDVIDYSAEGETLRRRPDWVPVSRQRGIEQLCLEFLDAVRQGRVLDASDALVSHEICEEIVRQAS
ncbi:Gfo/Idh/MocA family protein [Nonomuraea soli]|uniref:Virulence factor n=1 Tax=Nonomuraea soli TaxID=1032476 RepID=A0A7W0HMU0_9ACTN|nr:Gfo/Idh/MocA family oxidoreductase [Nonomuraea soli]MBA2889105.1 virulence factor [Nonomuraea soli]